MRAEQIVTADGTNWPDGSGRLFECGRSEPSFDPDLCHSISTFEVAHSSWSKSFESIVGTDGPTGSYCLGNADQRFTCYVEFQVHKTTMSTPITFKALKVGGVSYGGSYENGTAVSVTLANFPTEQRFEIQTCPQGPGYTQCAQEEFGRTTSSGTASFPNYQLDCVQVDLSGECDLLVTDVSKPKGPWVAVPFGTYGL